MPFRRAVSTLRRMRVWSIRTDSRVERLARVLDVLGIDIDQPAAAHPPGLLFAVQLANGLKGSSRREPDRR